MLEQYEEELVLLEGVLIHTREIHMVGRPGDVVAAEECLVDIERQVLVEDADVDVGARKDSSAHSSTPVKAMSYMTGLLALPATSKQVPEEAVLEDLRVSIFLLRFLVAL